MSGIFTDSAGCRVPCPLEGDDCTSAGTVETTLADHLYSNHKPEHMALMMANLTADNRELKVRQNAARNLELREFHAGGTLQDCMDTGYNAALRQVRQILQQGGGS
jgi:hypothetical protein